MDVGQRKAAWSATWGILVLLFGAGVVPIWMTARTPGSNIPLWPAWALGGMTVVAMYISISFLAGRWWPVVGRRGRRDNVDLIVERVGDRLRLMLVNYGPAAEFFVQVISTLTPLGKREAPQNWTVPWFEDNSTEPKLILTGARRTLDFARYDAEAVTAELGNGRVGAAHWWFSAAPVPTGARYYNLLRKDDLEEQNFTLVVRIMNASSGHYLDRELTVGIRNGNPVCDITSAGVSRW